LITLLSNLNFLATIVPTPTTKVRYITPAPITFPIDSWGTFLMLEFIAINNSGRVDAEDMIKEATINSLHFKILDILDNALTIHAPDLAITKKEIMKTKIYSSIIIYLLYYISLLKVKRGHPLSLRVMPAMFPVCATRRSRLKDLSCQIDVATVDRVREDEAIRCLIIIVQGQGNNTLISIR